jgi:hypothetical protein
LDEAVKQKNNRYAERCNAAVLILWHNYLGNLYEIIDRIARNLGYHVQGSKGKNLPTPLVSLAKTFLLILVS